jgi:hypothetical protein
MSAQDKLGVGMLMFLVFFVIAFLLIPRQVYQEYLASLRTRGRGRIVAALGVGVFALSLPYFYEVLVGFDNRGIARVVQILIGAAAYFVLIDVTHFAYKTYCAPALVKRRRK